VLRDIYAARASSDELVDAVMAADRAALERAGPAAVDGLRERRPQLMTEMAASGRWPAVALLIDFGFEVNTPPGPSSLHHAAGLGRTDLVRALVEHGADTDAVDDRFKGTPLQWAQTMSRRLGGPQASGADWGSVIDYLSSLRPD
jgi:hypothetical protein